MKLTLDNEGLCAVADPSCPQYGRMHVPVVGKVACDAAGFGGTRCWTCAYCGKMLTLDPVALLVEWSLQ